MHVRRRFFGLCLALALPVSAAAWAPPPNLDPTLGPGPSVLTAPAADGNRPLPPGAANLVFKPTAAVSLRIAALTAGCVR